MKNIYTIYCHGSGAHRGKDDTEIVNFFGHAATGEEGPDFLMLDGVGGQGSAAPMAGTFKFDPTSPNMKRVKADSIKDLILQSSTLSNIVGHGVTANIDFAIAVMANAPPPLPTVINMIGWSRGAVTALMLANRIIATFGHNFEFNIFAVDPVAGKDAGLDSKKETNRKIPAEVKNYLAILATGETRATFKPQDADRVEAATNTSNVVFLPFPGKHSTVAKNDDSKAKEVSNIIWSMGASFLTKFGTPTPKKPSPYIATDLAFLEEYTKILIKTDEYAKIKQSGLKQWAIGGLSLVPRKFTSELDTYVVNPEYFINAHHRKLFKAVYPNVFRYLFTSKGEGTTKADVEKELATMKEQIRESLGLLGVGGGEKKQPFVLPESGSSFSKDRADKIKYRGSLNAMGILNANDTNKSVQQ